MKYDEAMLPGLAEAAFAMRTYGSAGAEAALAYPVRFVL